MRIKLGRHLRRTVRPHIFEIEADAQAFHGKPVTQENVV